MTVHLTGLAVELPEATISGATIAERSGIPESVVVEKMGVSEKRVARDEQPSDLCVEAGRRALDDAGVDAAALDTPEERALIAEIARFPAVVEEAADDLHPHVVATYTRRFAELFNAFYRECPVRDATGATREARIALVDAARHTVANALDVLGVAAPESM